MDVALYVDLQDAGSDWTRPSQITAEESNRLINDSVNDYAGQWDRMTNLDLLREIHGPNLVTALRAWPERTAVLTPAWC